MSCGISLGWNCISAMDGVARGLRERKQNGYLTCPFDQAMTNYPGVIKCLEDDFARFLDPKYLTIIVDPENNDSLVYNTYYKFLFNHESPGHAGIYIHQTGKVGSITLSTTTTKNLLRDINRE